MSNVVSTIQRPEPDLVEAYAEVPSTILADVIEHENVAMDAGMVPMLAEPRLTGTAVTVDASPGDNLVIHKAITMARSGDVLVIDGNGYTETAFLGELMSASCNAHGLGGIVIDGAIRDRAEIREMGFPVFARGVHPAGPGKHDPGSINVPIVCGGVSVSPGDIVVGDDDGVAVVPSHDADGVIDRARQKIEAEAQLRDRVEDGEYLYHINHYDDLFRSLPDVQPDTVPE